MEASARWERVGAATGIVFVVLIVASFVVIPDGPPALDDASSEIRSFYVDNAGNIQASAFLTGLAGFFFLWFLGSVRAALERAEGPPPRVARIATAAGATLLALVLAGTAVSDVLATRIAGEADQFVTRALYELQAIVLAFAAFPAAAFTASIAVTAHRTAANRPALFAPLVTWLGFLLVPAWVVVGFGVFVETGAFSPTGAVGIVVTLVWLAWILAVSGSLLRRAGAPSAAVVP
jgi:hypothetical protein